MWKKIKQKFSFLKWLDPFHYVDRFLMPRVNPNDNEMISWIVYIVRAFVFAYLIYFFMGVILNTETPMVIVVSGSMEPVYYRGDVIVLVGINSKNLNAPELNLNRSTLKSTPLDEFAYANYVEDKISFENGAEFPFSGNSDIVVYFSDLKEQQIIHRVIAKINVSDGSYVITKGDNNPIIDQECGTLLPGHFPSSNCISPYPIPVSELYGKAVLRIPAIGCIKLWLFDDLSSILTAGKLPTDFKGVC